MEEQPQYAGFDWSGTTFPPALGEPIQRISNALFLAGGVTTSNLEELEETLQTIRQQQGKPEAYEFHGYEMTEAELLTIMPYLRENLRLTAVVLDKIRLVQEHEDGLEILGRGSILYVATAQMVAPRVLSNAGVRRCWFDEEIPKKERPPFNTWVLRELRRSETEPGIRIKHLPSDKHRLIQAADVMLYVLQRGIRGSFKSPELLKIARSLWTWGANEVGYIEGNDLRPYL